MDYLFFTFEYIVVNISFDTDTFYFNSLNYRFILSISILLRIFI